MELKDVKILDIIPQRPPIIMIDRLTYFDPLVVKTVFTIQEGHLFCNNGRLEEAGLIENIAQTCAARTGYEVKMQLKGDGSIKIGYIGMIKQMEIFRNPLVGEQLETTVEIVEDVFSTTLVATEVKVGDEVIATCEMKIFLTDTNSQADGN
ncbi:MAG: pseudouridylate synthase [Tannerella sp.]|jgi:predicted hotdog family 3-hydroxylacyl-ACP dehydratase|nr:pseudouridylate synthase [Tannerella sp.]